MSFDGRWLHGAPEELQLAPPPAAAAAAAGGAGGAGAKKRARAKATRVSLLVNVWLNHRPAHASPMPAKLAERLSPATHRAPVAFAEAPCARAAAATGGGGGGGGGGGARGKTKTRRHAWDVAHAGDGRCVLQLALPVDLELAAASDTAPGAAASASLAVELAHGEGMVTHAP